MRRDIPSERILVDTGNYLTWYNKYGVQKMLRATIDHVLPLSEGGSNKWDNLVPSCQPCNNDRTNDPVSFSRRLEHRRRELYNADQQRPVPAGLPSPRSQSINQIPARTSNRKITQPYSRKKLEPIPDAYDFEIDF